MSLQEVPSGERIKIGFFGRRNAGKSTLVNAITGQELSVVSAKKGTTTDAVTKSMELLPLGPVVIMDTPGFDDEGDLGAKRVTAARRILDRTDLAVLVTDTLQIEEGSCEALLLGLFRTRGIPFCMIFTKTDLQTYGPADAAGISCPHAFVSAVTGEGIREAKELIAKVGKNIRIHERPLVKDLLMPGDKVILVLPQDKAAPKGRLILPEQMMIRDILDGRGQALCVQETQLAQLLETLKKAGEKPAMVITDSQVFAQVAKIVPEEIYLTSFSILMARYNGVLDTSVSGVQAIDQLLDGDRVLISEGCTHHRQCGDIGTVKLPALLKKYTGRDLTLEFTQGHGFPDDPEGFALVIHCGGCMLGEREVLTRMNRCRESGVSFTNYGTAIAHMRGILPRSLQVFYRKN